MVPSTLQTTTESEDGVAVSSDFICPECGYQAPESAYNCALSETEMNAVTLKLKVEELPRLVAVLNEAYRSITSRTTVIPEFDTLGEWEGREWGNENLTVFEPLFSRREPESRREDLKDRIAVLRAYEVISTRLSDDSGKIGLLQPIG